MKLSFGAKLSQVQLRNKSNIALVIKPKIEQMPLPMQRYDDPFLPFGKAIINATNDIVCGYVFDLPSYLRLGAAGAIALERTIDYAGASVISILHGAFALPSFVSIADETAFGVDALTIAEHQPLDCYQSRPDHGVILLSEDVTITSSNPINTGIYSVKNALLIIKGEGGQSIEIRVADEQVLYAGRGEDFAQVIRHKIEQMRNG